MYKYLEMWVSLNGCEKLRISLVNPWVSRLESAARMRASNYDVVREVWKKVAVLSVMYGIDVIAIAWKENEIDKIQVWQNRVVSVALNASIYTAVEALRGDMAWSISKERLIKATLCYKFKLERMNDNE